MLISRVLGRLPRGVCRFASAVAATSPTSSAPTKPSWSLASLGIALEAGSVEGAASNSSSSSSSSSNGNGAGAGGRTDGGGAEAVIDRATLSHLATLSALSLESESIDADALLSDVGSMMRCVRSVQDASTDQDVDDIYSGGVMGRSGGGGRRRRRCTWKRRRCGRTRWPRRCARRRC